MTDLILAFGIYGLGIAISMLVALMIKGLVALLALRHPPPATVPAAVVQQQEDIAAADIPVIAAAVFAVLGTQRIVHIQDASRGRTWTSATRASHYASHMPRHSRR